MFTIVQTFVHSRPATLKGYGFSVHKDKMMECKFNNPPIEIKDADEWLKENYKLMRHCLLDSDILQFNKWAYDFRPYLKSFLYKFEYGVW